MKNMYINDILEEQYIIERECDKKYNSYRELGGKLGYWDYVNEIFNKYELEKIVSDIQKGILK